jgi:hypothetical protein
MRKRSASAAPTYFEQVAEIIFTDSTRRCCCPAIEPDADDPVEPEAALPEAELPEAVLPLVPEVLPADDGLLLEPDSRRPVI